MSAPGKRGHGRSADRKRRRSASPRPRRILGGEPSGPDLDQRPPEARRAAGRYETIARAPEGPQRGGRGASAGEMRASRRLGVRPARLVRRTGKRERAARAALRVLYRDLVAGGGLDIAGASRSPGRPPQEKSEDR